MRLILCNTCNKTDVPQNKCLKLDGTDICTSCFEKNYNDASQLEGKKVTHEFDPTVCWSCEKDFGNRELSIVSKYPLCDDCQVKIKNTTFPLWVKCFFAAIIVIVLFSVFWNLRFYEAWNGIKESNAAMQEGNYTLAADLMAEASNNVPEVNDVNTLSKFYKGLHYLKADSSAKALELFEECKENLPADYNIGILILQAKMGKGFDTKDYDLFLSSAKNFLALDTNIALSWAAAASAYACVYAKNGIDSCKTYSENYMNRALKMDGGTKEMKEYLNAIEYRLDSREIITRQEFTKKYPTGYVRNEKSEIKNLN